MFYLSQNQIHDTVEWILFLVSWFFPRFLYIFIFIFFKVYFYSDFIHVGLFVHNPSGSTLSTVVTPRSYVAVCLQGPVKCLCPPYWIFYDSRSYGGCVHWLPPRPVSFWNDWGGVGRGRSTFGVLTQDTLLLKVVLGALGSSGRKIVFRGVIAGLGPIEGSALGVSCSFGGSGCESPKSESFVASSSSLLCWAISWEWSKVSHVASNFSLKIWKK